MNDKANPSEIHDLKQWVRKGLEKSNEKLVSWEALSGDASLRRYFRAFNGSHHSIAVFSPPDSQNNEAFIEVASLLRSQGVSTPGILAYERHSGFMLQKDLGDRLLLSELNENNSDDWYFKAFAILYHFMAIPHTEMTSLAAYDRTLLLKELSLFHEWFLERLLDYQCTQAEYRMLFTLYDTLIESAIEQPAIFVHRDFHSRNIMVIDNEQLAVIDFQDAVVGPVTYDLVSLLKDCYVQWPNQRVESWVGHFYEQLKQDNLIDGESIDKGKFLFWFHRMGLQRHLKVLGIFSRLSIRDSKQGFLNDLPLVIDYVLRICEVDNELVEFADFFKEKLMPLIRLKDWGKVL